MLSSTASILEMIKGLGFKEKKLQHLEAMDGVENLLNSLQKN